MTGQARIGDPIGHGTAEGFIITASADDVCNGNGRARIGDLVICYHSDGDAIHGIQTIITGSPEVVGNNSGVARVGDVISCGATIIAGSVNVVVD